MKRLWGEGRRRGDTLLGVGLLVFSGVLVHEANKLPPPFFDPLGSAAAPRLVGGLLALLAIILIIRCLVTPLEADETAASAEAGLRQSPLAAVGVVVVPVVYLLLMQNKILGFAPASTLLVIVLVAILGHGRREILLASLPIALAGGYGLNALLTNFFYIDLPQTSFWSGAL